MAIRIRQERYGLDVAKTMKEAASVMDKCKQLKDEYFDAYQGDECPTDDDLANVGVTKVQLISAITFFENVDKFFNNQDPTTGDYAVTVNTFRRATGG